MAKYPYIELIRSFKRNYFYDSNRKEIVPISKVLYEYLENVIRNDLSLDECEDLPEEALELKEKGYLSNRRVQKIVHPDSATLEDLLDRRIQKITLQLTQNCNFRCKYCHYTDNDGSQRKHSNRKMSWELAKQGIDFLKRHSIDAEEVFVGFYGGEPLLEFSLLKKAVEYAEREFEGKSLFFVMTTNASMLTADIVEYLKEHNFDLMISLDGPQEINDRNRVYPNGDGTFSHVIDRLYQIYEKYPEFFKKMMLNMVLDPSVEDPVYAQLFEKYSFLKELNMSWSEIDDSGAENKNVYSEGYIERTEYEDFLVNLALMNRIRSEELPIMVQRLENGTGKSMIDFLGRREEIPEVTAPGGPCIPGELRLFLTVEGKFVLCERVSEISDCMILGDVETGIDIKRADTLLNVAQITADLCKECTAFDHCTQCAKYSDDHGVLSREFREKQCQIVKGQFRYALEKKILLQEAFEFYGERPRC